MLATAKSVSGKAHISNRFRRRSWLLIAAACLASAVAVYLLGVPRLDSSAARRPAIKAPALDNAAFIASLKLGGAIGGSRMQVIIDGTFFAVGDVIDHSRGLLIMKIDDEARQVTFIDTAGETHVRSLK